MGCSPWGREKSDMTERLPFNFTLSCIGEGNGNPLQCSCLENPRDGGAWKAAVYGVAQSRTRLKRLSSSSMIVYNSMGSDKHIMTCIHHYGIMQSNFTTLKILCVLFILPTGQSLATIQLSTVSIVWAFSRMSYSWNQILYNLFKLASFI